MLVQITLIGLVGRLLAFAALAVTAGFALAVLRAWLPHVGRVTCALLLALAFGWVHSCRGLVGVVVTGLVGGVLAALYLASGSRLAPKVLPMPMDLRALLIRLPPEGRAAALTGLSTREVS